MLGLLALIALLTSVLAIAASPALAATFDVNIENFGDDSIDLVSHSGKCGDGPTATVKAGDDVELDLDSACNDWSVTITDAAAKCMVDGQEDDDGSWDDIGGNVIYPPVDGTPEYRFWTQLPCIDDTATIEIEKDVPDDDVGAALLTTFTFVVTPFDIVEGEAFDDDGPCTDSSTHSKVGETDGDGTVATIEVATQYIANNAIAVCGYLVTELPAAGWTLVEVDSDQDCDEDRGSELLESASVLLVPTEDESCEAEFKNEQHLPLTVTKTFTGRTLYTTVDRANFHLYTPGSCGSVPFDPFGGLLGSHGVFRTANASQQPQIIMSFDDVMGAGPNGACTYRIQENSAPEGCVAVDPTGTNADGPYWEQTWVPGETTAFQFNIVNDCSTPEPTPDPTAEPTATTAPTKPPEPSAKKEGGSTAPKFTG